MRVSAKRFSIIAALLPVILLLSSCEDPGNVGSSFTSPNQTVIVDTIRVNSVSPINLPNFSGDLDNFSAGRYNDPMFGTIRASAVIMPSLPVSDRVIGEFNELFLVLHPSSFYGDTTSVATFDIVEIGQRWRGANWTIDTEPILTNNVLGSFQVGAGTDSVAIELNREWVDRFASYIPAVEGVNRDSTYRAEIFGFAIVPTGGDMVVGFSGFRADIQTFGEQVRAYLIVREILSGDVFRIDSQSWAFSLEHDKTTATVPVPVNATPVFNTFRDAAVIDFNINEQILGTKNISRVEVVLFEDSLSLQNSLPQFHTRPISGRTLIYRLQPGEKDFLILRNPDDNIVRTIADGSYRFNLLGFTNEILFGTPRNLTFVALSGLNNGLIYPNLLFNENDQVNYPKIIVTKVIPESF